MTRSVVYRFLCVVVIGLCFSLAYKWKESQAMAQTQIVKPSGVARSPASDWTVVPEDSCRAQTVIYDGHRYHVIRCPEGIFATRVSALRIQ